MTEPITTLTDAQIIALAREWGFLGAIDIVLDDEVAIQFARRVIEAHERIRSGAQCSH